MYKLVPIQEKEMYISCYPWIKECNFTEVTPEQVLANCLNGLYFGYAGVEEDEIVGIIICKKCGTMCFVVGLWCKGKMGKFTEDFCEMAKGMGYKTLRGAIKSGRKFPENVKGLTQLWTVWEREL